MSQTTHYNIHSDPSKEVPLTAEEFNNLSVHSLINFLFDYPLVFEDKVDSLTMYVSESRIERYYDNYRFSGMTFFLYPKYEMVRSTISKNNPLFRFVKRKLNHLILK